MGLQCSTDFKEVNHPNYSFSFPFCQRFATSGSSHYPCSVTDAMSCHSSDEATEASEMPKFGISPSQRYEYLRKDFDSSWSQSWASTRYFRADKAIRPHLYSIFQTYKALGLPMCHVLTVSGSSLPVPIFIGRWTYHIILQAEVTESGMKELSHMVGHEFQCRYQRIISSQANRLADATFSKSWEA